MKRDMIDLLHTKGEANAECHKPRSESAFTQT